MKDAMRNDLKVGDLVLAFLDRPSLYGRVASITEGGLIVGVKGGKPEMHMSVIVISTTITIQVDPREVAGSVLALREDNPPPRPGSVTEIEEVEKPN